MICLISVQVFHKQIKGERGFKGAAYLLTIGAWGGQNLSESVDVVGRHHVIYTDNDLNFT